MPLPTLTAPAALVVARGKRATGTVPEERLDALRLVREAPEPLNKLPLMVPSGAIRKLF